jgi:hypothetical protein
MQENLVLLILMKVRAKILSRETMISLVGGAMKELFPLETSKAINISYMN